MNSGLNLYPTSFSNCSKIYGLTDAEYPFGDHWIGMEPFLDEFKNVGLDAVVGSVGNGATLRLISDIPGVKYTEGRLLPYFFPDIRVVLFLI